MGILKHMESVQDLSSFRMPPGFRGRPAWLVQLWWIAQAALFHSSPQFLYGWRRWLLRCFGAKIGKNVLIRPSVRITYPWKLIIEDNAWVGDQVDLYTLGPIVIGHDAVVSQGSYLCTGWHDYTDPSFPLLASAIQIEPEAWISARVFIGPGVRVGRGTVVGVCSLVLKDLPPMVKAMGQPARIVGSRLPSAVSSEKR